MAAPFFMQESFRSAFVANMANRLRDNINNDCAGLLKQNGIQTQTTDVSIVLFLEKHPHSSISDIAKGLDYSHQRTAARMVALHKQGTVHKQSDPNDSRCTLFSLTELGQQDALALKQVYTAAATALDAVFEELECDLMAVLNHAVNTLERTPLSQRIQQINPDLAG